ncbi:amino acid adenylation domain-containing protein [Mariniphaga sp.]|uniref:amino acid adenylation domain-containing protein n=1 Tax=Mariniphaga sp. TaxID=1954475 RepID=UPI0035652700
MNKGGDKKKHTLRNKKVSAVKQESGYSHISVTDVVVEKLTQIWQEILEIDTISVHDNFFELGGHSILAMKGIVRIKEKFEIEISFKDFMNLPTITLQSEFIKTHLTDQKGIIHETKGKLRIEDKFEIEMAYEDSIYLPTISKQAELIKTPVSNLNSSGLLHDISHSENAERFPLTETQKILWYLCILNINSPAYNLPFTLKFTGDLNENILHKTIEYLFKRHDIIFATFHSDDGEPYLTINQNQSIKIKEYDLDRLPENELKKKYNEIIVADSRLAFNLEKGPLFRLHLLKINRSEWLFHMTIHHLVFDGISWGIFLKEFNSVYKSLLNTEDIKLEDIKFQQYHYAKWLEKNPLQQNSHSLEFWRRYLDGIPAYTNFPLDRSRKNPPSGKGAKTTIKISTEIANKIIALSKSRNTTVFTTMLSAFSLLIKRFSGENDLCIGSPVADRPYKFIENVFGYFVDTLPLRFNFEGINTFEDLLNYTKSTIFNVLENNNIGYDKIVEIVNPERTPLYNSIFQIAFVWPKDLSGTIKTGDLRGERFIIKEDVAPFDIIFYMWEINGDIKGEIEYNIDLFDESTINSLRESYIQLLDSVVKNTKENINNLRVVNENQFNILKEFNNTKVPYPQVGVCSILKQISDLLPKKPALSYNGQKVSYSELEEKSNQLALELIRNGVKVGEPVGIFMDKSNELIISIVAILKINCYYLPLDPEYPLQRTLDIIHDAACRYIITSKNQESILTGSFKKITIDDSIWQNKTTTLSYFSSPEDFAYIMYTSGTTGTPKGSIIKHKGILRLVLNTNYIHLEEHDNILLTGAIGFDASTFEIWGALLNGCTLFIIDKDVLLDPYKLEKEIIKNNITVLWLTSSIFTQITELNPGVFANLRYLLAGGDVLSIEHVIKIRNLFPSLTIINGYGPTENTTFSTCHIIQKEYQDNIPIGKPISNSTAYIFNEHLQLQPIGAFGELHVGGDGLSHGYLNRPELNAEKFINNPLNSGEKLFKTGDKARWLPDGNIEFHGRIDDQLKIRGYRVEPLEIEFQINKIPEIIESVVKPMERQKGNIQLYVFIHKQKESNLREEDIVSYLKERFPSYMIPAFYDFRVGLPKTINGKIDRKALKFNSDIISSKVGISTNPNDTSLFPITNEQQRLRLLNETFQKSNEKTENFKSVCEITLPKLNEINDTCFEIPNKLLHEFFMEKAEEFPDKTAVIINNSFLTYAELNVLSNQVANKLIQDGITPGDFVGINLPPSLEQIVVVLGVLKSGAAYLPLDPSFPEERLNYILEDSGASYVITKNKKSNFSKINHPFKEFNLENLEEISDQPKIINPIKKNNQDNIAYIIYTSGSTGNPKGVLVHHKAAVNFILSMSETPGICKDDRLLSVTTLSFDISVLEIFLPLSFGATLVLASEEDRTSNSLYKLIGKYGITILQATPATWSILLQSEWDGNANLKALCGGEAMSQQLAKDLISKVSELWNMYGPTETTVWSTCKKISDAQHPIGIGLPIGNTQVYILDDNKNLLPLNVKGEIAIGGEGVSKGYHNRGQLTKEKFIVKDGQILYRTGDIGKIRNNGDIEVYGRNDNQIKLNGFRIEPGEIESKLCLFKGIKEAVVKVHQYSDNDKRLVAFLLTEKDFIPDEKEIISGLKKQLPIYMIPSFIQFQKDFPRTLNGKTDRKKLIFNQEKAGQDVPEFDWHHLNTIELNIYQIISDIIKHKNFNADDSFFNIGGTSLLSLKLIFRIEKEFKVLIPVRDFLVKYNTVRQIGNLIKQEKAKKIDFNFKHFEINKNFRYLYRLQSFGNEIPIFSFYCEELFANIKGFSRTIYDFIWPGSDGRPFNFKSVGELAENYLVEIKKVNPNGPYYLVGFSFGGLVAYEIAQRLIKSGNNVPILFLIDVINPRISTAVKLGPKFKKAFTKHLFNTIIQQSKEQIKRITILIYFKLEKKLPPNLIQTNIMLEANKLMMNYIPQFYHGDVHLFKSEKNIISDPYLGWKSMVNKINWFSLSSHHTEAVLENNNKIKILSELKSIIDRIEINRSK